MEFLSRFKIHICLALYWAANVANVIHVSKEPGFYPRSEREKAHELAMLQPYPIQDIVFVSLIITVATAITYFLVTKTKHGALWIMVFSFSMAFAQAFIVPTDTGGVQYAVAEYAAYTFILALLYLIISFVLRQVRHVSKS